MRQLYTSRFKYVDDNNNRIINQCSAFRRIIRYGEIPESTQETRPIKDVLSDLKYEYRRCLFNKKVYYYYYDFTKYTFTDADTVTYYKIYEPSNFSYSFEDLSKYLNVDEFILYLKDRGLNTCPIIGGDT